MNPALRLAAAITLAACTESGQVLSSAPGAASPRVAAIATGDGHGCAVLDGALFCWGANDAGQLGLGDRDDRDRPARLDAEPVFEALAAGSRHTCALSATRDVFCFGDNARGQLGLGTRARALRPARVTLDRPVLELSCHFEHCCALLDDQSLRCWGKNEEGELGQGDPFPSGPGEEADQLSPVPVGGERFIAVTTGQGHSCAIRDDGTLWCWGRNTFHELGIDPREQVREPVQVGAANDWTAVAAGQHHNCALRRDRTLWCWGRNTAIDTEEGFPLGIEAEVVNEPAAVPLAVEIAAVATDTFHTCAIDRAGGLWCWGRNVEGQLGLAGRELRRRPELVGSGFGQVEPGRFSTCALSLEKTVLCAGNNGRGELGTGDSVDRDSLSPLAWNALW